MQIGCPHVGTEMRLQPSHDEKAYIFLVDTCLHCTGERCVARDERDCFVWNTEAFWGNETIASNLANVFAFRHADLSKLRLFWCNGTVASKMANALAFQDVDLSRRC
jgi:hypothetical protein